MLLCCAVACVGGMVAVVNTGTGRAAFRFAKCGVARGGGDGKNSADRGVCSVVTATSFASCDAGQG
jgi:hypothetical protein